MFSSTVLVLFYYSCGTLVSLPSYIFWHVLTSPSNHTNDAVDEQKKCLRRCVLPQVWCQREAWTSALARCSGSTNSWPSRASSSRSPWSCPAGWEAHTPSPRVIPVNFRVFILPVFTSSRSHTRRTSIQWQLGTRLPWLQRSGWVVLIKVSMSEYITKRGLAHLF